MAGPTLDDITESTCPDGTYHKCLPYGDCYDFQRYCSDRSRSVNSCFPDNIKGNNKDILAWCIEQITNNITRVPHPACKLACLDKFGIDALYQSPSCQNENSTDYTWTLCALLLGVTICLFASLIVNTVLLIQRCKAPRRQDADGETQDGNNQVSRHNSKDSVMDETGPADPPANAALDTDLNRNQAALGDRSGPSDSQPADVHDSSTTHVQNEAQTNQLAPVQGRNTNTQNTAQTNQLAPVQGRNTNRQNTAPTNLHASAQGRNTNTHNTASMNLPHNDQSTMDIQDGQEINSPQARDPVASLSAYFRRGYEDSSEESLALIPRNQESGDDTSTTRTPVDMCIHFSTTIPEAEGRHPVVTNIATYD